MVLRIVCIALLSAVICFGGKKEAHADSVYELEVIFSFSVDYAPKTVVGYRLYRWGMPVVTWEGAYLFTRRVVLSLPEFEASEFTLSAVYEDDTESLRSYPYRFHPAEEAKPASPAEFQRIASIFGEVLPSGTPILTGTIYL